jgi:hypothetical protein
MQRIVNQHYLEWQNFCAKEGTTAKSFDFLWRFEKDVLSGIFPGNTTKTRNSKPVKRWIDDSAEGRALKSKICQFASLRFPTAYQAVFGAIQVSHRSTNTALPTFPSPPHSIFLFSCQLISRICADSKDVVAVGSTPQSFLIAG